MIPQPPPAASPAADPARRSVLGVRVDDLTLPEAVERIEAFGAGGRLHHVVTVNPEMVMQARRDPAYRAALNGADLSVADGVGLLWATRLQGRPLRGLVPGSELVHPLAEHAARRAGRWFLLGGGPGVAEAAGAALARRYPGLVIAGTAALSPDAADDEAARSAIRAAVPVDLLLVAYGGTGQELWIQRNAPQLAVPVAIGVGGTFNFLAGRSRRPPAWVKRLGLIWLFRLVLEPWRWRRQLVLLPFVALALVEGLRQRSE